MKDTILDTVLENMKYTFVRGMLVKPLEDVYVEKEIIKPVNTGKKDENGFEITDTETVTEKVLTTFKTGIVLAIPAGYEWPDKENHPEVGDTVAFARKAATDFDLFKDSKIINPYDIVAFIKSNE